MNVASCNFPVRESFGELEEGNNGMRLLVFPEITTIDNLRWDLDRERIMEVVELGVIIWTVARCKFRSNSCWFLFGRDKVYTVICTVCYSICGKMR